MLRFSELLSVTLGCIVFLDFQSSAHGSQAVLAADRPDRLLPKETVFLFQSGSIGKVLDKFGDLAERTGIGPQSVIIKPTPGTFPRFAFGNSDPNAPPRELAAWPPQLHGPDADSFLLGPQFFEVFSKIVGTDGSFDFRRFCTEVLAGPGFIAVVKVSDDRYGFVFGIEVDQESTLPKLLRSESSRLDGQRVTEDALDEGIHWIEEAGICWLMEAGFLCVTDNSSLAQVLFERIQNPSPTDDCLSKDRLYQRLMLAAKQDASDFSVYSNSLGVAAYCYAWWEQLYPSTEYEWHPGSRHEQTMLGSIISGNFGSKQDTFLDLSMVRAFAYPFDDNMGFLRDVAPIKFETALKLPPDVSGVVVFGGNGTGEMKATLFPGRHSGDFLPTCGAFFYRHSGLDNLYSGFLWDELEEEQNVQKFGIIRTFATHGRDIRAINDSDLEYENRLLKDPADVEPTTALLRSGSRWYFLRGSYEIRRELRKAIMENDDPKTILGPLDIDYINQKIMEDANKNLVFVEACRMRESNNSFPISTIGEFLHWEAFFGFPPCYKLYQPWRLPTQQQREVSDIPATKNELLVSQKADRIDWLSDFWFRLRFALYTHLTGVEFSNPPVVYSFSYLERPGGILRSEIRVVLSSINK